MKERISFFIVLFYTEMQSYIFIALARVWCSIEDGCPDVFIHCRFGRVVGRVRHPLDTHDWTSRRMSRTRHTRTSHGALQCMQSYTCGSKA